VPPRAAAHINTPNVLMFYSTCAVGDHACLEFIDDRLVPDFHHCKSDSFNNLTGLTFLRELKSAKIGLHISPNCTIQ